jgi:signal transduction histidine kinase
MMLKALRRIVRTAEFRLPVIYALLFTASATILGTLFYWAILSSLERQMATRIETEIEILTEDFQSEGEHELLEEVERRNNVLAFEYLLLDRQGKRIAGNLSATPKLGWSEVKSSPSGLSGNQHTRYFRARTVQFENGWRLSVAEDLQFTRDMQSAWLEACGLGLLAVLILSLIGGVLLSHGFLRRVDSIRHTADAIVKGDLGSRIPLQGTNDNFDLLSDILNKMLDRIETLMESMIQVSNDIAHALRTPLTRVQQKLEAARSEASGNPGYENAIESARLETEKLLETFSALLRIAQIEGGSRQSGFSDVDLSELFARVTDAFSDLAEDEGKTLVAHIEPSVSKWGDRELLAEMAANLVDNAIRHTPKGAHIDVSLARHQSQIIASVSDDGLGVPKEEYARIFQRFYRLERSAKIHGTGLGLSFVAAVAGLHEIELSVEDNAPGFCIKMKFPMSAKTVQKSNARQSFEIGCPRAVRRARFQLRSLKVRTPSDGDARVADLIKSLTEFQLGLMRRAAGKGAVTAVTAEEEDVLNTLAARGLVHRGSLTIAGWKALRTSDKDQWLGAIAPMALPVCAELLWSHATTIGRVLG